MTEIALPPAAGIDMVHTNGKTPEHTIHTYAVDNTVDTAELSKLQLNPTDSYPKSGIEVLIVGTGLAGLTAAIECWRKGHNVRVLERNATINTAGDMYFMGHSATNFFKHWPEMSEEYAKISLSNAYLETFKHSGERMIPPMRVSDRLRAAGQDPNTPPGTFQMRPLVYEMFVHQVEKLGISIEYNSRVVSYAEDVEKGKASCTTEDNRTFEADLIIAADGVGSKSQMLVGGQPRAVSSGRAMWRAAFPIHHLDKNPEVKKFFHMIDDKHPIVRTWLGPSTYALTLTRRDTMIWIINHDASGSEAESWSNTISKEEVLEGMDRMPGPEWAPIFKELVNCTPPNTIINFELLWRDPQPVWCSAGARVVQIGDSAHSFLPASGNGATQAIEDAVSLASCLQIGGIKEVPHSVRAHVRLRFVRVTCAQKLGFSNAELLQDTDWEQVKLDPRKAAPKLPPWIFKHEPEIYAYENYQKAVALNKQGKPVTEAGGIPPNYPPGYKYEPWSIDKIIADTRAGKPIELGDGNWGV